MAGKYPNSSGGCYCSTLGQCYGGVARLYTKAHELIDKNPTNSIFLNAGDYFQGTMWYTILKWKPVVTLANMLNFTAYTLGNHDFDDGIDGLMPFLNKVNFPVLAANLDASKVPKFAANLLLNNFSYRSTYHSA
jgi:2',3'-cyclic-nucleotide 2'-phosphodiesterase (5'-nucleotidase family)